MRTAAGSLALVLCASCVIQQPAPRMERITMAGDRLVLDKSGQTFTPWGVNYGNAGRLIEDFWDAEWATIAGDFREIKAMGANVIRVHLQFGKFMLGPNEPSRAALTRLRQLVELAESTGLYLDITGLACYRPADRPGWYDAMNESSRWHAQGNFWRAVAETCDGSTAVFCYNLMNEPIAPADKRDNWYSGQLLDEYDFLQYISRVPDGRTRGEIATRWIRHLTAAIREKDQATLITVGLLPWVTGWKHLSGFIPREVAPQLDFISVHIYPKTKQPDEAVRALRECSTGKPVVIEEIFPLECSIRELEDFVHESRKIACGWLWHYDGITPDEYDVLERSGKLTLPQAIWRDALQSFLRLRPTSSL